MFSSELPRTPPTSLLTVRKCSSAEQRQGAHHRQFFARRCARNARPIIRYSGLSTRCIAAQAAHSTFPAGGDRSRVEAWLTVPEAPLVDIVGETYGEPDGGNVQPGIGTPVGICDSVSVNPGDFQSAWVEDAIVPVR